MKLTTIQLELIAAKAKQLATDYDSGRIWPGEFEEALQEIAAYVEKARNAAQASAPAPAHATFPAPDLRGIDEATWSEWRVLGVPAKAMLIQEKDLPTIIERACRAYAAAQTEPKAAEAPENFPAAIWQLLLTVADRKGTEYTGPWEGPNGEPMQDDADAAMAWIKAAQPQAKGMPVAWCALAAGGQIAYFDGKPMVMPGPVGNDCHPHPLYLGTTLGATQAA